MGRKRKALKSLKSLPIWLLIDAVMLFGALYLDMNVLPDPEATGHPVFAVTIIAAIFFGAITAVAVALALIRLLLWAVLGDT